MAALAHTIKMPCLHIEFVTEHIENCSALILGKKDGFLSVGRRCCGSLLGMHVCLVGVPSLFIQGIEWVSSGS